MNLYLLTRDEKSYNEYYGCHDIYLSCVVAAESGEEAKKIHPKSTLENKYFWSKKRGWFTYNHITNNRITNSKNIIIESDDWVNDLGQIKVRLLGVAADEITKGVICSDFNNG